MVSVRVGIRIAVGLVLGLGLAVGVVLGLAPSSDWTAAVNIASRCPLTSRKYSLLINNVVHIIHVLYSTQRFIIYSTPSTSPKPNFILNPNLTPSPFPNLVFPDQVAKFIVTQLNSTQPDITDVGADTSYVRINIYNLYIRT